MDDAFGMGGFESVGNLDTDVEEALKFEWAAKEQLFECLPFQVLHNNEGPSVIFANFVDGADIWMVQRRCSAGFTAEALEGLRILCDGIGQKFQGYKTAELSIFGAIYHTHASAAQLVQDSVMRDRLPRNGICVGHRREHLSREKRCESDFSGLGRKPRTSKANVLRRRRKVLLHNHSLANRGSKYK